MLRSHPSLLCLKYRQGRHKIFHCFSSPGDGKQAPIEIVKLNEKCMMHVAIYRLIQTQPNEGASAALETKNGSPFPFSKYRTLSKSKRRRGRYLSQARSTRKQGGSVLYERLDAHRCFAIYFFNPCLRVLVAWDKYLYCRFSLG